MRIFFLPDQLRHVGAAFREHVGEGLRFADELGKLGERKRLLDKHRGHPHVVQLHETCRKRLLFESDFPIFVPSLSCLGNMIVNEAVVSRFPHRSPTRTASSRL